jgi:hypothetical protein
MNKPSGSTPELVPDRSPAGGSSVLLGKLPASY